MGRKPLDEALDVVKAIRGGGLDIDVTTERLELVRLGICCCLVEVCELEGRLDIGQINVALVDGFDVLLGEEAIDE